MPLLPPQGLGTRPITDRVKESVFSILQERFPCRCVADVFCGTGSLGLESLSRGAQHAIFADGDRTVLKRLKKNITKLGFQSQATVIQANLAARGMAALHCRGAESDDGDDLPCELVFLDPPYRLSCKTSCDSLLGRWLEQLNRQLPDRALVVVRHEVRADLLRNYGTLYLHDRREYGSMAVSFLEKIVGRIPPY